MDIQTINAIYRAGGNPYTAGTTKMARVTGSGYQILPVGPSRGTAVVQSSSANTFGNWTQLSTGLTVPAYIVAVIIGPSGATPTYYEAEIGTGAAASEVRRIGVRHTNGYDLSGQMDEGVTSWLPAPFFIEASTRIAARMASSRAAGDTFRVSLIYVAQSDIGMF